MFKSILMPTIDPPTIVCNRNVFSVFYKQVVPKNKKPLTSLLEVSLLF